MAVRFQDLPLEIHSTIAELLGADDLVSLVNCVDIIVTKRLYGRVFPNDLPQSQYNLGMFRERCRAHVGIADWDSDTFGTMVCPHKEQEGIHHLSLELRPILVTFGGDVMVKKQKGWSFKSLRVHLLMELSPFFHLWQKANRISVPGSWREVVACGDNMAFGIDTGNVGCLWVFSDLDAGKADLVILRTQIDGRNEVLTGSISLLRRGWDVCCCLVKGYGVVSWKTASASHLENADGTRKMMHCTVVPDTQDVVDFGMCYDNGFFIHYDGRIHRTVGDGISALGMNMSVDYLPKLNQSVRSWGGMIRVVAHLRFAVLTAANGTIVVLLAYPMPGTIGRPPAFLVDSDLADVSLDNLRRSLVLTKTGKVFVGENVFTPPTAGEMFGRLTITNTREMNVPGKVVGISSSELFKVVIAVDGRES